MSGHTKAELFVNALEQYTVIYICGNPGTAKLPFVGALANSDLKSKVELDSGYDPVIPSRLPSASAVLPRSPDFARRRRYSGASASSGRSFSS